MMPTSRSGRVLLALIVGVAFAARVKGFTFALPLVHARPDELLIVSTALRFVQTGDLNPRFFDYPGFFLYFAAAMFAVYYLAGRGLGWFENADHFVGGTHGRWPLLYFMNRAASAVFGTLTTLGVYRIGRLLFDETAGLLSALFLALAFLHVRDSHYGTTDAALTFFIVCSIVWVIRLHQERRRSHAIRAALYAGLATGTKYNAVFLAVPITIVELLWAWRIHLRQGTGTTQPRRDWKQAVGGSHLPLMAVLMIAAFLVTSPYLVLDYQGALRDFKLLQDSMANGPTPPELLGPGWKYHMRFSLLHGLGLPLLASSLGGLLLLAIRQPATALILASFPVVYYVVAAMSLNMFVRYMMPAVPFLCVFAAYFVNEAARAVARLTPVRRPLAAACLGLLVVAPSAWNAIRFDQILSRRDSRLVAADWILEHVPLGTSVFVTGNSYGHPPLEDRVNPKYRLIGYEYRSNRFVERGRRFEGTPDWIVVQRSALPYSHIPDPVVEMLPRDYVLAHVIKAADLAEPNNVYDIQDAFYMPYGGFRNIQRPGPNFEIYQKRPQL
jgi:4-amino-4-deoxy-L-arabinose transferase-like glycosyltransferase